MIITIKNMFFKKIRSVVAFIMGLFLLTATSCSEDFLQLQPLDGLAEDSVFNDLGLLSGFVRGTYNSIATIHLGDRVGTDGLTDLTYWSRGGGNGVGTYTDNQVDDTNGEGPTQGLWSRSFNGIRNVNIFMEKTAESSIPQADLDPLIGQMRFIRAYIYYDMLRWYGGTPIIQQVFSQDDDFSIPRNSIDEVVAFIVSEADAALPLLPEDAPASRASKAACLALKAKTLLLAASPLYGDSSAAKWQAASDASQAVINLTTHPMADDYQALFNDGNLEDEIIFAREFNADLTQGGWSGANVLLWSGAPDIQGWSNLQPNTKFVSLFERQTDGVRPLLFNEADQTISVNPDAVGFDAKDPYADLDPRFSYLFTFNGATFKGRTMEYWHSYSTDGTGAPNGRTIEAKGIDEESQFASGSDNTQTGFNIIKLTDPTVGRLQPNNTASAFTPDVKFRTTEFYLNYAECQIALGNEDNARTAINTVRARPSVNMPAIPATVTGSDLVDAYRRERAIELFMEDQRFHDIRRWQIAEDVMGKPVYGVYCEKLSDDTFVYDYTRAPANVGSRDWDNKLYWLPIPLSEITTSNNTLTQNPGY